MRQLALAAVPSGRFVTAKDRGTPSGVATVRTLRRRVRDAAAARATLLETLLQSDEPAECAQAALDFVCGGEGTPTALYVQPTGTPARLTPLAGCGRVAPLLRVIGDAAREPRHR
ncbi:MAG: hypothetical protein ACK4N5_14150, partial [Myxococcales bacterium]